MKLLHHLSETTVRCSNLEEANGEQPNVEFVFHIFEFALRL